jgi:NitT/TauT family transport system substrate-binding protein
MGGKMKSGIRSALRNTLVLTAVLLLAGCGPTAGAPPSPTAGELQRITLAMGFIPNVQFAPFYVAVDKGYFAAEGLQIEFNYGWETDLLKLVSSDELQFAIASGDQVILARSQGLPVVYVLNWYRRFPVCIVSLKEAGIRQPQDLIGRLVGTPVTYGASYIGWRALVDATGLSPAQVELVSIGYTQVAALTEGQVDAAICYAMNEPVQLLESGRELDILYVADYVNLVSNGLITNEKSIRERPQLVQSMVRATLLALDYTLEHPDEAFAITAQFVPEVLANPETEAVNRAILAESIRFWKADEGLLGWSDEADWQAAARVMQAMQLVGAEVAEPEAVSAMYTNQFVSEVKP